MNKQVSLMALCVLLAGSGFSLFAEQAEEKAEETEAGKEQRGVPVKHRRSYPAFFEEDYGTYYDRRDPTGEMRVMRRAMDRLLERAAAFDRPLGGPGTGRAFTPGMNVYEDGAGSWWSATFPEWKKSRSTSRSTATC